MKHQGIDRSQTGRRILMYMLNNGINIVSVGSSDWVVCPNRAGYYPGDEAYFVGHILDLVKKELTASKKMHEEMIKEWYFSRIRQLEKGVLIYIAHQLDILASNG